MPLYLIETDEGDILVVEFGTIYLLPKNSNRMRRLNVKYTGLEPGVKIQLEAGYRLGPGKYYLATGERLFKVVDLSESEVTLDLVYVTKGRAWLPTSDEHGNYWGGALNWLLGKPRARSYQLADGYSPKAGSNVDFVWAHNGDLIFATQKGLFIQKTKDFTEWTYRPPLVLSSVRVDGELYNGPFSELRMEPNKKGISVSFAALDYSGSETVRYRYLLEGESDDWVEVGADMRTATFANIFPGEYLFRLQSTNRLGEWSGLELAVPLTVMPAWYQSYAFYLACILLVLLLLYALYLWRLGYYRRKKVELENLVNERTEDLAQSMEDLKNTQKKLLLSEKQASLGRLVSGVAHEINTPLGVIKMAHSAAEQTAVELFEAFQINKVLDKPVHSRLKKFQSSNQLVESNLHRLSSLVDSFKKISVNVEEWKFKAIDMEDALTATVQTFRGQAESKGVTIRTDTAHGLTLCSSPIVVQSVISELIKNALLHGFPDDLSGDITVRAFKSGADNGVVIIECEDTGVGISQELYPVVFDPFTAEKPSHLGLGLHVIFNFVSHVLSGEISCSNGGGSGCCFTILIPNQVGHLSQEN